MIHAGLPTLTAQTILGGNDIDLVVTATGSTSQANSYAIRAAVTEITTAASASGVRLPADANPGDSFIICNKGANTCLLYPPSGGTINGGSTNAAINITAALTVMVKTLTPLNFVAIV